MLTAKVFGGWNRIFRTDAKGLTMTTEVKEARQVCLLGGPIWTFVIVMILQLAPNPALDPLGWLLSMVGVGLAELTGVLLAERLCRFGVRSHFQSPISAPVEKIDWKARTYKVVFLLFTTTAIAGISFLPKHIQPWIFGGLFVVAEILIAPTYLWFVAYEVTKIRKREEEKNE